MSEFDTIFITNPTDEDFTWNYNGEPYTLKANVETQMPHFLARHLSKHLSDKILRSHFLKKVQKKRYKDNPALQDPEQYQYCMLDTHDRRIALYKILHSKEEVERTIKAYPQFKVTESRKRDSIDWTL